MYLIFAPALIALSFILAIQLREINPFTVNPRYASVIGALVGMFVAATR